MSQAEELRRGGLYCLLALDANFSERQMEAFRKARAARACAAVAYGRAKGLNLHRRGAL